MLTRSQSVDLASLAQLCEPTAGQLYHYCPFLSPADDDQLYNDLRWNVQRPQVSLASPSQVMAVPLGNGSTGCRVAFSAQYGGQALQVARLHVHMQMVLCIDLTA